MSLVRLRPVEATQRPLHGHFPGRRLRSGVAGCRCWRRSPVAGRPCRTRSPTMGRRLPAAVTGCRTRAPVAGCRTRAPVAGAGPGRRLSAPVAGRGRRLPVLDPVVGYRRRLPVAGAGPGRRISAPVAGRSHRLPDAGRRTPDAGRHRHWPIQAAQTAAFPTTCEVDRPSSICIKRTNRIYHHKTPPASPISWKPAPDSGTRQLSRCSVHGEVHSGPGAADLVCPIGTRHANVCACRFPRGPGGVPCSGTTWRST
jgi:hypothetical protein